MVCFKAIKIFCKGMLSVILVLALVGCEDSEEQATVGETRLLSAEDVKVTLRKLPYRFKFRRVALPEGAHSAIAGTAVGRHGARLNFGVAFGRSTKPVPVPRAGTKESLGYRSLFIYTNDLQVENGRGEMVAGPQIKTRAQWNEAISMSVEISDRLCKSATGEACPI